MRLDRSSLHIETIHKETRVLSPRVYQCRIDECREGFSDRAGLMKHHHDQHLISHRCPHCGLSFEHNTQLLRHLVKVQNKQAVIFRCLIEDCRFTSNSAETTRQHARSKHYTSRIIPIEDDWGLFDCEACGKQFTSLTQVDIHQQTDHRRAYWPMIHDIEMTGTGFPDDMF